MSTTTSTESTTRATKPQKGNSRAKASATKTSIKPALAKATTTATAVAPDQRMKMVAEAAYYLAEQRGFSEGNAEKDWITAETQIDQLLSSS